MAVDQEPDHRVRFVESLDEDAFRKIVLMPLLSRLGYREIIEYHGGSAEKGKDIICWYVDPMERRRYVALVIKKGDIHGAVGKAGNASEVLHQVQQTFNEPYRDIYALATLRVNECIIATTGRIKNTAIESISGSLAVTNLDRIIQFVDRHRVVDLVTMHMPEFWLNDQYTLALLHELRGPLSSIAASAANILHIAGGDVDETARVRRAAERIAADAEIAQRLAERQYELRNPGSRLRPEQVDIRPELERAVSEYGRFFHRRPQQTVSLKVSADLGRILLDRRAFRQVMFNLLENAFRYGLRDGPIEVVGLHAAPHVIIRVRNQGPGVKPNHEELIFQPFYTASPEGPGLGLYVARKLIQAMGGELRLTRLADPTEFSVYLPTKLEEKAR
jgi:signal transduction histidine kinase